MIFSFGEMERRADLVREAMRRKGLDLALLHSADNVYYVSGAPLLDEWGRPMWAVLDAGGDAALIGASLERESMAARSWMPDQLVYEDAEQSLDAALRLTVSFAGRRAGGRARIGIERSVMSLRMWDGVSNAFPEAEFVDIGDDLAEARIIKSGEELDLLRLGATVAKLGANAFVDAVKDGVTELTVAAAATAAVDRAIGALYPDGATSSYAYCQTAANTLSPHLHPTGRRIRRGDLVALNVFPVIWGYCIELERTFVFGEPTEAQQRALDAVNQAFDATKAAFVPGAKFSELDENARQILAERGYGKSMRHGTGHAHGIMIGSTSREELGEIRTYNPGVVRPGMANSVEPGIFVDDLGAFRHSDVLIVEDKHSVCITDFPRDILLV